MRLSTPERIVAWRLATQGRATLAELIVALWGNREDGGPEYAAEMIRKIMHFLRGKFEPHGIEIEGGRTLGYFVTSERKAPMIELLAAEIALNVHGERRAASGCIGRQHRELHTAGIGE
jgi:hypothetical protein